MRQNSLTVAVDTPDLWELSAGATRILIIGNTLIQADQLPVVTTGLVTRHRLHQVRAVSRSSRRLIGDLSLPEFETYSTAKSMKSHVSYIYDYRKQFLSWIWQTALLFSTTTTTYSPALGHGWISLLFSNIFSSTKTKRRECKFRL